MSIERTDNKKNEVQMKKPPPKGAAFFDRTMAGLKFLETVRWPTDRPVSFLSAETAWPSPVHSFPALATSATQLACAMSPSIWFLGSRSAFSPPKVNMQFCSSFKNSTQCASPRLNQRKTSCSPCVNSSPTVHRHRRQLDYSDLIELNHRTKRCPKSKPPSCAFRPFEPEDRYAIAIELDHSIGADHLELGLGDEETCDTTANSREQRAGSHLPMQERCRTGGKTMENVRGRQASKKA